MKKTKQIKGSPIFRKILIPMIILIIVELLVFACGIFGGGIISHLNKNAADILNERVINRKNYLENEMVNSWSNVDMTLRTVNGKAQEMINSGTININTLDNSSEDAAPFLMSISNDLITLMRNNRVTGSFVILNGSDLDSSIEIGDPLKLPGLYFRDLDPVSNPSDKNMDIFIMRGPTSVVQNLEIPTDSFWKPSFEFKNPQSLMPQNLYQPFQQAYYNTDSEVNFSDLGYWSRPYTLSNDNRSVISYTVPLVLADGTVYGVLGIEITLDYLRKIIPYSEILDDKMGSYIIAVEDNGDLAFDDVLVNGPIFQQYMLDGDKVTLTKSSDDSNIYTVDTGSEKFYCSLEYINLYNTNTPFASQRWALIGAIRQTDIFAFSNKVSAILLSSFAITLVLGIFGCLFTSKLISLPVVALSKNMDKSKPGESVKLARTGISEIDRLANSIEKLNDEAINTSKKFTQIMKMASVKIAGFEFNRSDKTFFVTDNLCDIFQVDVNNKDSMTCAEFKLFMETFNEYIIKRSNGFIIYRINRAEGLIYVNIKYSDDGVKCFGLVEDVTQATIEREMIEHQRDYDLLTGLKNRRAFHRIVINLFVKTPEKLKTAALLMMDLDNLKTLNDTFGHDCGDKYIRSAAECFVGAAPESSVVSRISGDEFLVFFYGYDSKDKINILLSDLYHAIEKKTFILPNGEEYHIKVSGGIAWYPDDSDDFETLIKFSDYAMYKVKHLKKGEFGFFDKDFYNKESYLIQNRQELFEMLEKERFEYHMQPIVSANTGKIFAYEALMRPNTENIRSMDEILMLARMESKLNQIEEISFFHAMKTYVKYVALGLIDKQCLIFINSIASQAMSSDKIQKFEEAYGPYLNRIVVELTEEEQLDEAALEVKRYKSFDWNSSIAIDDYGSGYNNEKMLLTMTPKYIKIDMSIIRNINKDADKRQIVFNMVAYAHQRRMLVVAEGIETEEEAGVVVDLGVDFLQGYFIARPKSTPPELSEAFKKFIDKHNKNR